jgi:hypothetical protein
MTTRKARGSSFVVDLSGLKLPEDTTDRIAKSIQRAVLTEIAALDLGPEYAVSLLPAATKETDGSRALKAALPGTTQGIIVEFGEVA